MYFFFLFYLLYLYKKLLYDLYYKLNNILFKINCLYYNFNLNNYIQ